MRILFIVPKMFTRGDLTKFNPAVPDDYQEKSAEFWNYVVDRLRTQRKVNRLYYDSLTQDCEEALRFIKEDNVQCYLIIEKLAKEGASLEVSEDRLLVEETASWVSMLKEDENMVTQELLLQNMQERNKFVAKTIGETMMEGETGVLFISSDRRIADHLPSDMKVIKIQPFDPSDYLNSWLVSLRLKSKSQGSSEGK